MIVARRRAGGILAIGSILMLGAGAMVSAAVPPAMSNPDTGEDGIYVSEEARAAIEDGVEARGVELIEQQAPYTQLSRDISDHIREYSGTGWVESDIEQRSMRVYARVDEWTDDTRRALDDIKHLAEQQGITLEFHDVAVGEGELADIADRVLSDVELHPAIRLTSVEVDSIEGRLVFKGPGLHEDHDAQELLRDFTEKHGRGTVGVEFLQGDEIQAVATDHRLSYGRPYRGGARLHVGNKPWCTAGVGLEKADGSLHYILTAAHCTSLTNGVAVQRPDNAAIGVTQSIQNLYGPINNSSSEGRRLDAALVRLNGTFDSNGLAFASNRIWTGFDLTGGAMRTVQGWAHVDRGVTICVSGSFEGTSCNVRRPSGAAGNLVFLQVCWTVNSAGNCTSLGYVSVIPLEMVYGQTVWGTGDSGATIYSYSGNKVIVYGITQGIWKYDHENWPTCTKGETNWCGARGLMTPMHRIIETVGPNGVRVRTG